ncbi:hypothetical protein EDB19DRAFT_490756 [Suillus lakei]|nr:hypothetical protein EDB19DRAFT_490756 [Suillus lakei]
MKEKCVRGMVSLLEEITPKLDELRLPCRFHLFFSISYCALSTLSLAAVYSQAYSFLPIFFSSVWIFWNAINFRFSSGDEGGREGDAGGPLSPEVDELNKTMDGLKWAVQSAKEKQKAAKEECSKLRLPYRA